MVYCRCVITSHYMLFDKQTISLMTTLAPFCKLYKQFLKERISLPDTILHVGKIQTSSLKSQMSTLFKSGWRIGIQIGHDFSKIGLFGGYDYDVLVFQIFNRLEPFFKYILFSKSKAKKHCTHFLHKYFR